MSQKVSIVGGGAWGTALACVAQRATGNALIWARETEVVDAINTDQTNPVYLKDKKLPDGLRATNNLKDLKDSDIVLLVPPAQHLRTVATELAKYLRPGVPVLISSKGIEVSTGKLMSQVLEEVMPNQTPMVLSGPTFASEVADDLPAALTLAAKDTDLAKQVVNALALPTFRIYTSNDIIGAQIGGAIKNVLAIATGMVAGLKLGENTRAAVITRGLAEMMRFGKLYGAQSETLMGLSGLGDLILTCSSTQSRNMSLGKAIGEGQTFADIMATRNSVAEGAHTVEIVHMIAMKNEIDMPITCSVYAILKEGASAADELEKLLSRPLTNEIT